MIKRRYATFWQLVSTVRAATLELKAGALQRAMEARYRVDQPRAPRGTPIGGRWIDDVVHVAARKPRPAPRCNGFASGCQNGGSFGSSGMFKIDGRQLCWDCAIKYLGIQGQPSQVQIDIVNIFNESGRGDQD